MSSERSIASAKDEEEKFDAKKLLKAERQVLYKEERKLTPGEYLIEVSTHKK